MTDITELRRLATEACNTLAASEANPDDVAKFNEAVCADRRFQNEATSELFVKLLDVVEAAREAHRLRTEERDRVMAFALGATTDRPSVGAVERYLVAERAFTDALAALDARNETDERGL